MKRHKNQKIFIAKPGSDQKTSCHGLRLVKNFKDIEKARYTEPIIVQEYITNPRLIGDRKADFSVYALVQSLDPFTVFVSKESLGRFCCEKYVNP